MLTMAAASLLLLVILGYRALVARRPRPAPLRNDEVAGLAAVALGRLLERVSAVDRAGEAVPASASIWVGIDEEELRLREGAALVVDGIADAAVDFAAVKARAHRGDPITEAVVMEWLREGVARAIAGLVAARAARMSERLKIITRSPRPSREEIEALLLENAREQEEISKLRGDHTDSSQLPSAKVRKR